MSAKFTIGIDLGTTNCVLAYAELDADVPKVHILEVDQVTAPGTIEKNSSLSSFLYVAAEHEVGSNSFDLPWAQNVPYVVGQLARQRSAESPDRTISAAKSWLCNHRVDRRTAILPWNAPNEIAKLSPVTASQRYLEHLAAAWNNSFPDAKFTDQQVVLTVPASFDPMARELTREAATAAGLPSHFVLLEEPQAALYAWLDAQGDRWRKRLRVDDTILVCDVGGGTTDLSLISVREEAGELQLNRVAVGDHLLVGGDNMDLALAHQAAELFKKKGTTLNPWQSVSLWHSCRAAKETLLAEGGPKSHTISVLGRGSKLIGGTVSIEMERDAAVKTLLEGFLPSCKLSDRPEKQRVSGFQEIGLPFESDPRITRHLATFFDAHVTGSDEAKMPNKVLFNGGVFKSMAMRERLLEALQSWAGKKNPTESLDLNNDLDNAVARGAAHYGWSKEHGGVRIRGGVARSYYIGIETSGLAIPGAPRPLHALCVVPNGMEEGTESDIASKEIGLLLGEPTQFRFFSSSIRKQDQPGDLLTTIDETELIETDPLEANLSVDEDLDDNYVPVQFVSKITELGVFELWCKSTKSDNAWKLEFSVREDDTSR